MAQDWLSVVRLFSPQPQNRLKKESDCNLKVRQRNICVFTLFICNILIHIFKTHLNINYNICRLHPDLYQKVYCKYPHIIVKKKQAKFADILIRHVKK